jgi:hypothetical protein
MAKQYYPSIKPGSQYEGLGIQLMHVVCVN